MANVGFENGAPILQKEYSIAPHMYDSSFKDWQRKFIFPKNYVITAVFAILAIIDIILVAIKKFNPVALVVVAVCIAIIAVVWVGVTNTRKKFVQGMARFKDERQTVQFFNDGIIIKKIPKGSTEGEKITIDFARDSVKILDKRYYFIVYVNNSNFNIIPKKVFDAAEETTLAKNFEKKLGEDYIK